MSRSDQPFFGARKAAPKPTQRWDNEAYKKLHWVQQLEQRPLRKQKRWEQAEVDFDNRTDNWDDNEYKETIT